MSILIEDISFERIKDRLVGTLYGSLSLDLTMKEVRQIGDFDIVQGNISFRDISEKRARNKLSRLLSDRLGTLTSSVTKNPVTFISAESGIPLIGSAAIGLVDRNSNLIEVKPLSGCNMNCIFCSVDEGLASKKVHELFVDPYYLASESAALVKFKGCECHLTINAHGEPLMYGPIATLVQLLRSIGNIKTISLITNGTLLTQKLIGSLADSGLSTLNISLNAIDEKTAKMLEGHGLYNARHIKEMARYAAQKLDVIIAPVYLPGYNDAELERLVLFAKEIGAQVGIQNFLPYTRGRNPTKSLPFDAFYEKMRVLEDKTGVKLIVDAAAYGIQKTKAMPKPFRRGRTVTAVIACPGRYRHERLAVAQGRSITIAKCDAEIGSKVSITITGDKHNLFYGKIL